MSDNETYYYHTGSGLVQELDGVFDVTTDYMAGIRRYMPGEADADKYRYFLRDHQGTVMAMTDHGQNVEHYSYDAWGEHVGNADLPDVANRIRYAAGHPQARKASLVGGTRAKCFLNKFML